MQARLRWLGNGGGLTLMQVDEAIQVGDFNRIGSFEVLPGWELVFPKPIEQSEGHWDYKGILGSVPFIWGDVGRSNMLSDRGTSEDYSKNSALQSSIAGLEEGLALWDPAQWKEFLTSQEEGCRN